MSFLINFEGFISPFKHVCNIYFLQAECSLSKRWFDLTRLLAALVPIAELFGLTPDIEDIN